MLKPGNQTPDWVKDFALFGLVLSNLLTSTGAGIGLGYLVWKYLHWPWWTLLVLSILGLVLGMIQIWKLVKKSGVGR